ncbi:hypothetical protein CAPTEDRAFT_188746 [Capitella teleta]|uniref:Uncharacterized protein n=1 Tax=Capitella teleta TaxID=283909 RepID=R7T671_CAPTE|nr:hypothetical protein CAPTEDRAFT_188746 [Capitella teleta]|eukprot:ELT89029.1 hypothetical protein CAPTEDRAFT_188746 [Capitella teleta]
MSSKTGKQDQNEHVDSESVCGLPECSGNKIKALYNRMFNSKSCPQCHKTITKTESFRKCCLCQRKVHLLCAPSRTGFHLRHNAKDEEELEKVHPGERVIFHLGGDDAEEEVFRPPHDSPNACCAEFDAELASLYSLVSEEAVPFERNYYDPSNERQFVSEEEVEIRAGSKHGYFRPPCDSPKDEA